MNFAKLLRTPFLQNTSGQLLLIFQGFAYFLQPHILRNSSEWLLPYEHQVFFLMSKIKLSTHIHSSKVNNKSTEIKHDICSKLHVMFENYMVSTKFTYALFRRQRHSRAVHRCFIKKLFWKISQNSPEHIVIGVLFYQVAGIQFATLSKTIARYRCFEI